MKFKLTTSSWVGVILIVIVTVLLEKNWSNFVQLVLLLVDFAFVYWHFVIGLIILFFFLFYKNEILEKIKIEWFFLNKMWIYYDGICVKVSRISDRFGGKTILTGVYCTKHKRNVLIGLNGCPEVNCINHGSKELIDVGPKVQRQIEVIFEQKFRGVKY